MRLKVSHFLALIVVAALSVGLMASPAFASPNRAHKMSAKQKAHIRASLRKQVKKSPKAITRKSFLKKAALVNFKLPVTLRLRGTSTQPSGTNVGNGNYPVVDGDGNVTMCGPAPCIGGNPNRANVDLGASLGQRQVALGGSLSAEITFHDSFDGGALGNVSLDLLPDAAGGKTHALTTTSIPLLWNNQVTSGRFDANDLGIPDASNLSGCNDIQANGAVGGNGRANLVSVAAPFTTLQGLINGLDPKYLSFGKSLTGVGNTNGLPGYPVSQSTGGTTLGYLGIPVGLDDINLVKSGDIPGNNDVVGPSKTPFPTAPVNNGQAPGGFTQPPDARNTVLRTNALSLNIATAGTAVNQSGPGFGPEGGQNIVIGKSGGEANLFGNIPGKSYGIDVTASFSTPINSIIRVVDQDSFHTGLIAGQNWPAGVFNCREIWTGSVPNYIPGVRLTGNLKIAPGLTYDGHLRIAKATVSSQIPARFAVAACLSPAANYAQEQHGTDAGTYMVPDPLGGATGATEGPILDTTALPISENLPRQITDPYVSSPCDSTRTNLIKYSNLGGQGVPSFNVSSLTGGSVNDGYTTSSTGAKVSVGADLDVKNVSLDVLIGDV